MDVRCAENFCHCCETLYSNDEVGVGRIMRHETGVEGHVFNAQCGGDGTGGADVSQIFLPRSVRADSAG